MRLLQLAPRAAAAMRLAPMPRAIARAHFFSSAAAAQLRAPIPDDDGERADRDAPTDGGSGAEAPASPAPPAASDGLDAIAAKKFRAEHQIDISGDTTDCPTTPLTSFAQVTAALEHISAPFARKQERLFEKLGYTEPSVIQAQSWPITLAGRDCIGISKTGSGKTLGFMLTAVSKIVANRAEWHKAREAGPYAVVLAPTRELAQQIVQEATKLTDAHGLGIMCTYGGESRNGQSMRIMRLERARKFDVLVSTPGRLQDFVDDRTILLDSARLLVLDEADRMLDMGFEPQIRGILESMKSAAERQTLLFSATWPNEVRTLAADFTNKPVRVMIGDTDKLTANRDITQQVHVVPGGMRVKSQELMTHLGVNSDSEAEGEAAAADALDGDKPLRQLRVRRDRPRVPSCIVFANKKSTCDHLEDMLREERVRCAALHGDLTQRRRDNVIRMFKDKELDVLLATDVAARGLDIKGMDMVINYDFPPTLEDYVHRIGRTGRAGRKGVAVTLFTQDDSKLSKKLVRFLAEHEQRVPDELRRMAGVSQEDDGGRRPWGRGGGGGRRSFQNRRGSFESRGGRYGGGGGGYGGRQDGRRGAGRGRDRDDFDRGPIGGRGYGGRKSFDGGDSPSGDFGGGGRRGGRSKGDDFDGY